MFSFCVLFLQYLQLNKPVERDSISQLSQESDSKEPSIFAAGDIRRRLSESLHDPRPFTHDPEDPSAAALKVDPLIIGLDRMARWVAIPKFTSTSLLLVVISWKFHGDMKLLL